MNNNFFLYYFDILQKLLYCQQRIVLCNNYLLLYSITPQWRFYFFILFEICNEYFLLWSWCFSKFFKLFLCFDKAFVVIQILYFIKYFLIQSIEFKISSCRSRIVLLIYEIHLSSIYWYTMNVFLLVYYNPS